jgi:hypothetical protein
MEEGAFWAREPGAAWGGPETALEARGNRISGVLWWGVGRPRELVEEGNQVACRALSRRAECSVAPFSLSLSLFLSFSRSFSLSLSLSLSPSACVSLIPPLPLQVMDSAERRSTEDVRDLHLAAAETAIAKEIERGRIDPTLPDVLPQTRHP